jgi:hypothetical protein
VHHLETIAEAVDRLTRDGYTDDFRAEKEGLRQVGTGAIFAPESLCVDEVVRFEGETDPGSEAIVFALRHEESGARGTFVTTYGARLDPAEAEMVRRLHRASR